jgi:hypothetical protein
MSNKIKKGIIYMATFSNGKHYVGQTIRTFVKRRNEHLSNAENNKIGCTAFYNAIRIYGPDDIEWEILIKCDIDELDYYELLMIETYDTLSPNGYNLIKGGNSNKTMSDETRFKIKQAALNRDTEVYRKNEKSKGLPKYVAYFVDDRYEGYKISKHPKCESKYFYKPSKTLEENKNDALDFLKKLDAGAVTVIKKIKTLPYGVQKYGSGYRVHLQLDNKMWIKNFDQKDYSNERNLQRAVEHVQNLQEQSKLDKKKYEDLMSRIHNIWNTPKKEYGPLAFTDEELDAEFEEEERLMKQNDEN